MSPVYLGDIPDQATVSVDIVITRPMLSGIIANTASAYSLVTGDDNRAQ